MKQTELLFLLALMSVFVCSCSESEEEQSEYANWKEKNEEYFHAIYEKATTEQSVADGQWKTFLKFLEMVARQFFATGRSYCGESDE